MKDGVLGVDRELHHVSVLTIEGGMTRGSSLVQENSKLMTFSSFCRGLVV